MRALKALVIGMGVLIVAGIGVIAVTIANRAGETAGGAEASRAAFGHTRITIPPGSKVVESSVEGDRIVVRLSLASGGTRILVVDLATGRELGTIGLVERDARITGR